MSRPAPKTKLGKLKRQPTVKETRTPTPKPEKKEELVISGRLTQIQWEEMIQKETDEIVREIMDDLLSKVMDRCHKVDLERQCIPHTVCWAENYLTQAVQHQFVFLDKGDDLEETCGTEDCEPAPSFPDFWAEGCVRVVQSENDFYVSLMALQPVQGVPLPVPAPDLGISGWTAEA
uniref:Uncharacterized protein n=1 Tax=Nothobranchius rachovii TaxID=451742 RepID=A0A1A8NPM4_9TELE